MLAEAEPARAGNITAVLVSYFQRCSVDLQKVGLAEWSAARYQDMELSIQWVLDRLGPANATLAQQLLALGSTVHAQGNDWETWYDSFPPSFFNGMYK